MAPVTLNDVIPILDVKDMESSLHYYVQRLGFQVEFRYVREPDNYAGVGRDNVHLHMQWQALQLFEEGRAGQLRLRIPVGDPDALLEELRGRGAFGEDVKVWDTPWGTREFGFRDLDGNGLSFYRNL